MKRIFSSIWFLSLILSIPVILFLPPVFEKYNLKFEKKSKILGGINKNAYFIDLENDGTIERIESFYLPNNGNQFSFQLFAENGGMVEQVNWPGAYHTFTSFLRFFDVDNDGHKEIYSFRIQNDSLWLQWIQMTPVIGEINSLPVCPLYTYRDSLYNYSVGPLYCEDLEGDGINELIFAVAAGYSIIPRQIFKVDITKRMLYASENTGCANSQLHFYDLDGNGIKEIIADGDVAPFREEYDLPYNKPSPF